MVLKLLKNLYKLNDARLTWFEHLLEGLENIGLAPIASNSWILVTDTNTIILYVDHYIILSRTKDGAVKVLAELDKRGNKITDDGNIEEYLEILTSHGKDKSFRMLQPFLINKIIVSIPGIIEAEVHEPLQSLDKYLTKTLEENQIMNIGTKDY